MKTDKDTITTIDEYIAPFPKEIQRLLQQMRATIKKAAPKAEEIISYAMPAFSQYGALVYFAGYKNHIGFYPTSSGIRLFQKEIAAYKSSKGAVQFPLDKPLPLALITKIVKQRVQENEEKFLQKNMRICKNGHHFIKTSDCPTCPICEKERKPKSGFLSELSAPAIRALENKKIKTLLQLSKYSEADILALHGMGPGSIPKLRAALKKEKLSFKK
jgi:uncharacterized protein YdhG (YjbR/CyaY superfamily)